MAWRFKASKYKNAAPIVPKFEQLIRDLSIGSYRSHGNFIASSAAFMAFNWDTHGSSLAVLPLDTQGRRNKAHIPMIYAHSETVTDFQFSPFDDGLLATGSQDSTVKLWRIPEKGLTENMSNPELVLPSQARRIETVNFHPTADCILATSSGDTLVVWNLIEGSELYTFGDHGDEVQSVAWQHSGKLLATQCKDRHLRILDPRNQSVAAQTLSHEGIKDSRVVWIGDTDRVFTSGFNADRLREIAIRDIRKICSPVKTMTLDMSSGILVPLFDPDTNMCFLSGKGDRNIQFIELTNQDPFIVEGLKYTGDQTKGACLVPKRAMNVMQGEVNRILQLCDSSIVPIMWQVPRKSYRDYHADIYPDTFGVEANMGPGNWWTNKKNNAPSKISLDPKRRSKETLVMFPQTELSKQKSFREVTSLSNENEAVIPCDKETFVKPQIQAQVTINRSGINTRVMPKSDNVSSNVPKDAAADHEDEGLELLRRQPSIRDRKKILEENIRKSQIEAGDTSKVVKVSGLATASDENKENNSNLGDEVVELRSKKHMFEKKDPVEVAQTRPVSKMFGRVSKFKHMKGQALHKSQHFDNLKNLSKTVPVECNFVHANSLRIALPLSGPGGKLAVFEINKAGRIPDGVQPVLINGTNIMDFAWDPFDPSRLIAACDDGHLRLWVIPENGLTDPVNTPESVFPAHSEKIQVVKFHPLASDIVLTTGYDRLVKIWDLNNMEQPQYILEDHEDQLFSAEWSPCGRYVATLCKDKQIRIYDPRHNSHPILTGGEITPKKGGRVLWVLDGDYLIVTGFSKQSEQQVTVYKSQDLAKVHEVTLAVSPALLIPYYDEDSSTLFLTGRGESTVTTFEVARDDPHLFSLSAYRPSGLHQGFAFLPKNTCQVREVEFARAYRMTNTTIEPISFTVPRVKTAFFQDDLFSPTRVLWEPTFIASEWLQGLHREADRINLQPADMKALTSAIGHSSTRSQVLVTQTIQEKTNKQKMADLEHSLNEMLPKDDGKLEQDDMEGVDESEWLVL